jgi:endothelin-converting enzyme/putative endopeptidase
VLRLSETFVVVTIRLLALRSFARGPKRMNWKAVSSLYRVLAAMLLYVPGIAQAQSEPEKTPERLVGLDKSMMDIKADPCVDFFQYACGNFATLHPILADRSGNSSGNMLNDYNVYLLRTVLEKAAIDTPGRTPNEQKIGDFYAACMDTKAIDARGLRSLTPELERIEALKSKDDLPPLLAHFQLIGVAAFFSYASQQDFKDARKQIAVLDQSGLGLPDRDYYLRTGIQDEKTRREYVGHIRNMLMLIGESETRADAEAKKAMRIETTLATNSLDAASQRDPSKIYHMMPLRDLAKLTPKFSWDMFLAHLGAPPTTEINVASLEFIKRLNTLLGSASIRTLRAYLRWQLLASTSSLALPKDFDEEDFRFNKLELRGQGEQQPRSRRCAEVTDGALGDATGQVYVAQEFPLSSKAATVEMIHNIKAAMDQDIDTLDWMSSSTKLRAREKLHMIADKIGYPDKWRDYSKLVIRRDDALGNFYGAGEFENRRQLAKIGQPVDHGEWTITAATVDAYYNPSMNDINFPAGVLQPPVYDPHANDAVNYGHLGSMVGHEITHAFDDQGRLFDRNGNMADWWTSEDSKQFEQRTDCVIREYDNFTVGGDLHVNGKLTVGENTADNGGLRLAYIAFLDDAKRKGLILSEKDDGYIPEQQFFLAYGQSWCGVLRPEQERLKVHTDEHSPRRFRVNGAVENMPEFGKAFGCKIGQPMMPPKTCHVW